MKIFATQVCAALAACALALPAVAQSCLGDIAVDNRIDGGDLGVMLANWGPVTSTALSRACDLDGNAIVNGADLGLLLSNWGACPPQAPAWATLVESYPDPSIVTDPALRAAIIATGLAWRVRDTGTQMEMLLIPPGAFQMGCGIAPDAGACQADELPVHQVTLTNAFYLGRFEVTQSQWVAKMSSNPSYFQGQPNSANRPVEQVAWNRIQDYLNATSMRLATEAEWEFACRAGTSTPFYNGSTDPATVVDIAWFNLNSGMETHTVGLKAANNLGLYDMLGNVGEWVRDYFSPYSADAQVNPLRESGSYVVMRGGSWGQYAARSSERSYDSPNIVYQGDGGFRVARDP